MNRNFTRYSRGGMLLDLENQNNHYRQLLQPRKSMNISEQSKGTMNHSLNLSNKFQKQMNKIRQQQNERLYKALQSIKATKGTIQLMSERAKQEDKNKKLLILNHQFKLIERKKQLRQQNRRIVQKIGFVKPRIGNITQWDEHYDNFSKQKRKISRVTQHFFNLQTIAPEINTEIKHNLRETLDFHKTSKQKSRKNRTVNNKSRKKRSTDLSNKRYLQLNQQDLEIIKKSGNIDNHEQEYKDEKFEALEIPKQKISLDIKNQGRGNQKVKNI